MKGTLVSADRVSKWYGEVVGLNALSIDIGPGITGLVGPNGAGKTTLIRLATGQCRQSAGTLRVLGEDPFDNPGLMARVGYCPEHEALYGTFKGEAFLSWMARLRGYPRVEAQRRASSCLSLVGLGGLDRPVRTYSKGMRQRLKIAQALLHDPELLILDEPFSGVDPVVRASLFDLIRRLSAEGLHVVLSSHILYDVERLADAVVLMAEGKAVFSGTVSDILDELDHHERSLRLETPDPRAVGARLLAADLVSSLSMGDGFIVVRSVRPTDLYNTLPALVAEEGLPVTGVTPQGTDLQALFDRLVGP